MYYHRCASSSGAVDRKSCTQYNIIRSLAIISITSGGGDVRVTVFYAIFWRGRDGLTNGLLRRSRRRVFHILLLLLYYIHRRTLVDDNNIKRLKTRAREPAVHRSKSSSVGRGHTRRLIPMANRNVIIILLYNIIIFVRVIVMLRLSRDYIIIYIGII